MTESDAALAAKLRKAMDGHTYARKPRDGEYYMNMTLVNQVVSALEASDDKAEVLKALEAAANRLSSLMPRYCEDCGYWSLYSIAEHNADHVIKPPEKFIRAAEVLKLITEAESKKP